MKTILQTVAIGPLLASSAIALSSSLNCHTLMGTKSISPVPSTTVRSTAAQPTITVLRQSTVTRLVGLVSTSTLFLTRTTTTTNSVITDTFTSTPVVFEVQTETDTSTITSTTTQTSTAFSTSTTTTATTAGFKNIADTLNVFQLPQKRALGHPHDSGVPQKRAAKNLANALAAQSYPAAVSCTTTVANPNTHTVYSTLQPSTSTSYYWSKTVRSLQILTSTSTVVPPDVTVTTLQPSTSTVQTTVIDTEIDTATTSTTTTSVLPGPTVWDACGPNNVFGPNFSHGGKPYYAANLANNGPGVGSNFLIMANGASSPTECCNDCQMQGCETWAYRAGARSCFLMYHAGETCDSQVNHPNFFTSSSGYDSGFGYTVGNGNCGWTHSANSDGTVWSVDGY